MSSPISAAPPLIIPRSSSGDGNLHLVAVPDSAASGDVCLGAGIRISPEETVYNGLDSVSVVSLLVYVRHYLPVLWEVAGDTDWGEFMEAAVVDSTGQLTDERRPLEEAGQTPDGRPLYTATAPSESSTPAAISAPEFPRGTIVRLIDADDMGMAQVGALAQVIRTERVDGYLLLDVEWVDARAANPETGTPQMPGYYVSDRFEVAELTEDDTIALARYRLQGGFE